MGESVMHERGWAAVGVEGGGRELGIQAVSGAGSERSDRARVLEYWSKGDVGREAKLGRVRRVL